MRAWPIRIVRDSYSLDGVLVLRMNERSLLSNTFT